MIDTEGMVAETAAKIYTDLCGRDVPHRAEAGEYPQALWSALDENGLALAWVSEENGGFDADYAEVFGAIWTSAQAASPVPFAETLIANWLLDRAGLEMPGGAISFAIRGGGIADVPFGDVAEHVTVYDANTNEISLYKSSDVQRAHAQPLSPDAEARLDFADAVPLAGASTNLSRRALEALVLTVRAVQMAASMEAALSLTLGYVTQREQFGRPLAKFQAIQQQLAVAASESAAATMAATQAASSLTQNKADPEQAWHEAVIAKIQIGHGVETVTEAFHQVHGAMGYTQEYDLHHFTRRLWAWREALGNEHHWSGVFGSELAAVTPDQIWKGVTTGQWIAS